MRKHWPWIRTILSIIACVAAGAAGGYVVGSSAEKTEKTWPELYGPMIAALVVSAASFCGIYYTAKRNSEQKKLDSKIALNDKQILILSELVGEIRNYESLTLKLAQSALAFDNEKDTADKERFTYLRDRRNLSVEPLFEARSRITKIAASYGTLPNRRSETFVHLVVFITIFTVTISEISADDEKSFDDKVTDVVDIATDAINYVLSLITFEEVQRSQHLGSARKEISLPNTPEFVLTHLAQLASKEVGVADVPAARSNEPAELNEKAASKEDLFAPKA